MSEDNIESFADYTDTSMSWSVEQMLERNLKDIRDGVLAVFSVEEEQAESDIFQFIAELEEAELIVGVE